MMNNKSQYHQSVKVEKEKENFKLRKKSKSLIRGLCSLWHHMLLTHIHKCIYVYVCIYMCMNAFGRALVSTLQIMYVYTCNIAYIAHTTRRYTKIFAYFKILK